MASHRNTAVTELDSQPAGLAETYNTNPIAHFSGNKQAATTYGQHMAPVLDEIQCAVNCLDSQAVKEAFMFMLGYCFPKYSELRVASIVFEGLIDIGAIRNNASLSRNNDGSFVRQCTDVALLNVLYQACYRLPDRRTVGFIFLRILVHSLMPGVIII
ncbi:uncharacterized protein ARMOST_04567 [Armillaria ostoyae]|uniref:Uncharacterized protein n=1 Tax=Armillaria ostoyae TaxID=47428 RepID=A0A284QXP3_ARMOS|nr:uncharacterized protein ARMOST_04567 [Armillaria ostoyae]